LVGGERLSLLHEKAPLRANEQGVSARVVKGVRGSVERILGPDLRKRGAVVTVDAVLGSDPEIVARALGHSPDNAVGQPVVRGEMIERVRRVFVESVQVGPDPQIVLAIQVESADRRFLQLGGDGLRLAVCVLVESPMGRDPRRPPRRTLDIVDSQAI
jgi:hypothetical protein